MLLAGLKILDFTYLLPGPLATMTLADLGAEVLKVESPTKIDLVRLIPPFVDKEGKISCVHAYLNRNKRSLALDLKHPSSAEIIARLIKEHGYNIVVEQFRPGVMERLGLSYERLSKIQPDIIYCSITGYGQTGPWKDRAGHDINYLSLSGVMGYSGKADTGPTLMGIQVADVAGSFNTVIGILAAVIHRTKSSEGQHVDIAMTDCLFPYHALTGTRSLSGDREPAYETELLNGGSLYGFFETADEKYLSFGGLEQQFSTEFFKVLGLPDLIEGGVMQFAGLEEAKKRVRAIIRSQSLNHWIERFKAADACVEPVLSFSEAIESNHVLERGLVVHVPGPDEKKIRQIACPLKLSHGAPEYRWAGCALGRDNDEIMQSLGFNADEIGDMKARGLFGTV